MPRRLLTGGGLTTAGVLALLVGPAVAPASAQRSIQRAGQQSELEQAEAAYLEVDFEGTRDHALEALRAGGHTPEQLVRIYQLLGTATSALGDQDAARDYFVRMLGIDPDTELDQSVPPRLRGPYLEASGVWAARQGRLGVEAGLDRPRSVVHVALRDPTDMARRVRVAARLGGEAQYQVQEYRAAAVLDAPVAGAADADRVEYYVEILDMHGNVIVTEGSAFRPRVADRAAVAGGGEGGGATVLEEPLFWIIVGAAAAAVAGGITAAVVVDQRSRIGVQTGVSIGIE